jgi:hypothetical protein
MLMHLASSNTVGSTHLGSTFWIFLTACMSRIPAIVICIFLPYTQLR